jgi:hypothetical protein
VKTVWVGSGRPFGKGRICEVPTTWAEGEKMITDAIRYCEGRGSNAYLQSACARIAYGLCCDQELTPDPTAALAYLVQRICIRKGAGL